MNIVIISKNFYPVLGPRAHRATELAKELSRQRHDVTVLTLTGDFDYQQFQIQTGVTVKNLGYSKFGLVDNAGKRNNSLWNKIVKKFFSTYLEFPNIELMFLTHQTLRKSGEIDFLITSAHPHPIHWGAAKYIANNPNKVKFWVADCGDPFIKDPFNYHPWYFKYLEKKWGKLCNYISVPLEEAKDAYYEEFYDKIKVIPQGFNFDEVNLAPYHKNKIPTFAYSGHVYKNLRDPSRFLLYLSKLDFEFKFVVYSKSGEIFKDFKNLLGEKLEIRGYVPRQELLFELSKVDFLINIKNESDVQAPSKLIDYAMTKRPILEISSDFKEEKKFIEFLNENYINKKEIIDIEKFNIKNIVKKLIKLKTIN